VGDDWLAIDEGMKLPHHPIGRGSRPYHRVGDAGQFGNEGRDRDSGIHQALVAFGDAPVLDPHGGDFGGSGAMLGRYSGGFEVENDEGGAHVVRGFRLPIPSGVVGHIDVPPRERWRPVRAAGQGSAPPGFGRSSGTVRGRSAETGSCLG